MRKLLYILTMFSAMNLSAQIEKQQAVIAGKDTTTVNRQLQKDSDLKTMDAVKTQDHGKSVPKPKNASKSKDTTKVKKRAQR